METEKSAAQLQAEKDSFDRDGHSEKMTDIQLNQTATDTTIAPLSVQKSAVFQIKKKNENVLLDTTHE